MNARLMWRAFAALQMALQRRILHKHAELHSEGRLLRKAWVSLRSNILDMAERRAIAHRLALQQYESYITRTFLALKWNVMTEKGIRCLQHKRNTQSKFCAWNALRFNQMLSQVGRNLKSYRAKQTLANMFGFWLKRARDQSRAKDILRPWLLARYTDERASAFREWKRQTFLVKGC